MSTPLQTYMKKQKVGDAALAALINRDRSMVSKLRRGVVRPTLDVAAAIETATEGGVPMQAWAAVAVPA
jgi:DNA-binding transcriptional regulator YdaS (Cro superfamily)